MLRIERGKKMGKTVYNQYGDYIATGNCSYPTSTRTVVIPGKYSLSIKNGKNVTYAVKGVFAAIASVFVFMAPANMQTIAWFIYIFLMIGVITAPINSGLFSSIGATKIVVKPNYFSDLRGDYDYGEYRNSWSRDDMHDIVSLLGNDATRDDMITLLYAAQNGDINVWNSRKTFGNMKTVGLADKKLRSRQIEELIDKYDYQASAMRSIESSL